MTTDRRRGWLLGVLLVGLAGTGLYGVWTTTTRDPGATSNHQGAATAAPRGVKAPEAPDVHLQVLSGERPKPVTVGRNLFSFKPKAPPPMQAQGRSVTPAVTTNLVGPPPLPPITLKFIGIIEQGGGKPKIAVLSDGIGPPLYGEEGKLVAGRYKILRIGVESIEMSYLDGRGRQTIRLSGS